MRRARKKTPLRLTLERIDRSGIPLAELIAVHEQFRHPKALSANLGDGFLYAHNPIFRNVRDEFLRCGFRFTRENIANYFAFPLMALDDIIAEKKIPYRENFPWLKELEKKAPGTFSLTELKRSEIQFNYIFHESAHFIAHFRFFGWKSLAKRPKNRELLLQIMLGEAFANTVECLSAAFAEGEIGAYFLDANCHFRANAREVKAILRAARGWGYEPVARILLAAFLYSNFLYEKLGKKERQRILEFSGLSGGPKIDPLIEIGLQLSEPFRVTTTPLHLLKTGFSANLEKLIAIDPMEHLLRKSNQALRENGIAMIGIICRDLDAELI